MLSTLLVGFGFSAQTFHLPFLNYLPDFVVDGVVSSKPDLVNAALPDATVYTSLEEALEKHTFDLVVITTPNHLHAPQAKLALEYNCHVLVEKPFTLSTADAEALVSLAKSKNRKLCVYHNRRFDGDFLTLKKLMAEGTLGDVKRFESRFDRFRPTPRNRWRENAGPGSGIFWDLGPHLIDQALQLFGEPKAVSADIVILREGGQSDDCFDVTLHYEDKVIKLGSSAFQGGATLRFDVQGTKASYRKFYLDPQEDQLRAALPFTDEKWAVTPHEENGELGNEATQKKVPTLDGQYLTFFKELAKAVAGNTSLPADANSVVAVIRTIELAIEANAAQAKLMYK